MAGLGVSTNKQLAEEIRTLFFSSGSSRHICPECSHIRKKQHQRDKTLSVHEKDGLILYNCHHCGASGATPIHSPEPERSFSPVGPKIEKPKDAALSQAAVSFLMERGISQETAEGAGVFSADHYIGGETQEGIWFPYGGKKSYAHKIRAIASKAFTQAGGATTLWLAEQSTPGEDLIIVEGEIDALSIREVGHRSVVSVPNGAPVRVVDGKIDPREDRKFQYVWQAKAVLEKSKRIIIAADADEPGQALAEELARRIGKAKCWRIVWPEGCKDANDVLRRLGPEALKAAIQNPEPWPVAGVYEAKHFQDRVLDFYDKGLGKGAVSGFGELDELYSMSPGCLTVITGVPGSGKSTWLNALMVQMAKKEKWTMAIYSSETPPEVHIPMLASLYMGKPFFEGATERMSKEELKQALEWVNEHFVFLHSTDTASYEEIIERLEAAVMRAGIRAFLIDPANYLRKPNNCDEVEWVGQMLEAIRAFAQSHDCHAWVIAHPKKMQPRQDGSTSVPKGYDITGSAHWYNRPDFGLTVHRDEESKHITQLHVWKVRFWWTGKEGQTDLFHDRATGRFGETPFQRVIYSLGDSEGKDPWDGL